MAGSPAGYPWRSLLTGPGNLLFLFLFLFFKKYGPYYICCYCNFQGYQGTAYPDTTMIRSTPLSVDLKRVLHT